MDNKKFIEILCQKNIMYSIVDESIIIDSKNGGVYLRSLNNKTINYRNKKLLIKHIDGYSMIITSSKNKDDFTIYNALFFKGGELFNLPKCFIAERNGYFAHGESLKEAISDCNFKYLQNNIDISSLVKEIKQKQTVTKNEYRLLTGACKFGVNSFVESHNITVDELPLDEVLKITSDAFGGQRMKELFL